MTRRDRIRNLVAEYLDQNDGEIDVDAYGAGLAHRDYPDAEPRHIVHDVRIARREWQADQISTTVCVSDIHIPFHHRRGVANFLDFIDDVQPDNIVFNGDTADCIMISSFATPPNAPSLQDEVDQTRQLLRDARATCPDARIEKTLGNHEERTERMIQREPGLHGFRGLTWGEMLDLDELDIGLTPYKEHVEIDGVYYTHGHRVRKHAGYTAKSMHLDDGYPRSVIGHVHRLALYSFTGASGERWGIEAGGLFDRSQADYITNPNWQNGFVVIESRNGEYQKDLISVNSETGSFWHRGKSYDTKTEWT